jgi:hypothetical protein
MLNTRSTFVLLMLLLTFASCRQTKQITRANNTTSIEQQAKEAVASQTEQQEKIQVNASQSTEQASEVIIIRYDTDKPRAPDGTQPIREIERRLAVNKQTETIETKEDRKTSESIQQEKQEQVATKQEIQHQQKSTERKRISLPLPKIITTLAIGAGLFYIFTTKTGTSIAMGIASRLRKILKWIRSKLDR